MPEWLNEILHPELGQHIRIDRVLLRKTTDLQELLIFENAILGRVLVLDGVIQTTEADEFIYHEMLSHVPILAHGCAQRVLVLGGGDGGMIEEVLKHDSVEKVVMVEVDRSVVNLCQEYLPTLSQGAFDDPRLELVLADGSQYPVGDLNKWLEMISFDEETKPRQMTSVLTSLSLIPPTQSGPEQICFHRNSIIIVAYVLGPVAC